MNQNTGIQCVSGNLCEDRNVNMKIDGGFIQCDVTMT